MKTATKERRFKRRLTDFKAVKIILLKKWPTFESLANISKKIVHKRVLFLTTTHK